jgi:hypothetical protein
VVNARPVGDVTRGRALEAALGKSLHSGIQQFLLRDDTALLLFSRGTPIARCRLVRHVSISR